MRWLFDFIPQKPLARLRIFLRRWTRLFPRLTRAISTTSFLLPKPVAGGSGQARAMPAGSPAAGGYGSGGQVVPPAADGWVMRFRNGRRLRVQQVPDDAFERGRDQGRLAEVALPL